MISFNIKSKGLWFSMTFSIAVHLMLFYFLSIMPHPEKRRPGLVPVSLVSVPPKAKKKEPFIKKKEIVSLPQRPAGEDKRPKDSRFLAEKSRTVKKETRLKNLPLSVKKDAKRTALAVKGREEVEKKASLEGNALQDFIKPGKKVETPEEKKTVVGKKEVLNNAEKDERILAPVTVRRGKEEKTFDGGSFKKNGGLRKGGAGKLSPKFGLKDLLPSRERLSRLEKQYRESLPDDIEEGDTIALNTTEFRYASYFSGIKRKIELVWSYPPAAVRLGEQGNLRLKFVIKRDGNLKEIKLLRSSGYPILDNEAITAIRSAAPYNPFPKNLKQESISIVANFEYVIEPTFYKRIR